MERMFQIILVTSFYSSIVGISIIIIKTLLKNRISPKWHYIIWIILVIKLIIPFGPESTISIFNKVPSVITGVNITHVSGEAINTIQNKQTLNEQTNTNPSEITLDNGNKKYSINFYLSYVWLLGALLLICALLYTNYSLYLKLKKYSGNLNERVDMIFKEVKSEMGVNKSIQIIFQPIVNTPSLFGLFKPKIILPIEILDFSDREISYILLHELAHYKRRDILVNYILLIFQSIHWFNPIIWFCFKRIRDDMELATDQKVLSILQGNEYREYGRVLLKVLESLSSTRFSPRLIGIVDDKKNMEKRIKMIKMGGFFKSKRPIAFIIGFLCIVIMGLLLLTSGKTKDEKDINKFQAFMDSQTFKILVSPEKYALTMSSTIGIKLQPEFVGEAKTIQYYTSEGKFAGLDISTGKVEEYGKKLTLTYGIPVYWLPLIEEGLGKEGDKATVRIEVYNENHNVIAEKEIIIVFKDGFYAVVPNEGIIIGTNSQTKIDYPKTIDKAVSSAIIGRASAYKQGKVATEGHVILDSEEKDGIVKVYTVASYGAFGFENGVFTFVSGSGSIPTVIVFKKNNNNEYILKEYKEPMDGSYYTNSIKDMFPKKLWDKVLNPNNFPEIRKQQEEQATKYLESIGRKAEVISNYTERKLANINVQASNKLFSEYTKFDQELNKFPYWLGTIEKVEDGVRYIYETSQSKTSDGYDLIIFTKKKEDGIVVKEYKYKIVGGEPKLVE
ncbi:regulatory protein BlaR1 [Clostridium homopropionicum DSM 5847]|uniref:Regulatory protein BlaR1 n=1 Tax=Clostridium homopropionicum DSM 5847 TaxID=1121318 RepID=A0A0L6Z6W3_9CLOT|nr:M56 family metallopeptidase [Clostridium homopropionicum]KOA18694.1 regulatory protein BlaR1 [Clostridium homopropionicum DSM 5847]SFG52935.1 bla regulator protein blaR1 [Clostridium homopropionicum]